MAVSHMRSHARHAHTMDLVGSAKSSSCSCSSSNFSCNKQREKTTVRLPSSQALVRSQRDGNASVAATDRRPSYDARSIGGRHPRRRRILYDSTDPVITGPLHGRAVPVDRRHSRDKRATTRWGWATATKNPLHRDTIRLEILKLSQ